MIAIYRANKLMHRVGKWNIWSNNVFKSFVGSKVKHVRMSKGTVLLFPIVRIWTFKEQGNRPFASLKNHSIWKIVTGQYILPLFCMKLLCFLLCNLTCLSCSEHFLLFLHQFRNSYSFINIVWHCFENTGWHFGL